MSALAGAILITTATTSCKKGDQGPAGANGANGANGVGKDGKGISSLETDVINARLEHTESLMFSTKDAVHDVEGDVVAKWVTKEDKDKSSKGIDLYLNQTDFDAAKANAAKYVSDAEFAAAEAKLIKSVTTGNKVDEIAKAKALKGGTDVEDLAKSKAIEKAQKLEEITVAEYERLKSLLKESENINDAKIAKEKAKNAILDDVNGKLKAAAKAAHDLLVISKVAGNDVTDEVKTATLNLLKQKAAKAKLEAAEKALADSKAPVATGEKSKN